MGWTILVVSFALTLLAKALTYEILKGVSWALFLVGWLILFTVLRFLARIMHEGSPSWATKPVVAPEGVFGVVSA